MVAGMSADYTRHHTLKDTASRYAALSLENYAHIRALAERIAREMCAYLHPNNPPCVFLVPPQGPFQPRDYGRRAFTVSGRGFLPLGPIGFGLAVRVSDHADFLRVVLSCAKEGEELVVRIKDGGAYEFHAGEADADLSDFFAHLYQHILNWYEERIRLYEEGHYGGGGMGFEMVRIGDEQPDEDADRPDPDHATAPVSDY